MRSFTGMRDLMEFKPGKHQSIAGNELLRRKNGGHRRGNEPEQEEEREGVGEIRLLTLKLMA
jgi:hypothetical protein